MPQRFLKDGLTTSRRYNACSWPAQTLFTRLIDEVDDFARYDADPQLLTRLFPFGDPKGRAVSGKQVQEWLNDLHCHQMVVLYETDGKPYLHILRWTERIRSERGSLFPPPPDGSCACRTCTHPLSRSHPQQSAASRSESQRAAANAASPSSSSSTSPSSSSTEGEREMGLKPSGEQKPEPMPPAARAEPASEAASKAQWGALNQRIAAAEKQKNAGDLSPEGMETLRRMKAARDGIQKKQARGDFRLTDLGEFGL